MPSVITSRPPCNRKPLPPRAPAPQSAVPEPEEPWDDDDLVVPLLPARTLYRSNRGMQFPRTLPALCILIKRGNVIQRIIELPDPRSEWIQQFNERPGRSGGIHAVAAQPGRDYADVAPVEPVIVTVETIDEAVGTALAAEGGAR